MATAPRKFVASVSRGNAPFHGSRLMPYRPTAPTAPPRATHITEPNGIPPHKQLAYSSRPW